MNPLEAIEAEIRRYQDRAKEIQATIAELEAKKAALLDLPETCPSCKGSGRETYTDAAGSRDWRDCLTCKGLGKIGPMQCRSCGKIIGTDMIHFRRCGDNRCPWCGSLLSYIGV